MISLDLNKMYLIDQDPYLTESFEAYIRSVFFIFIIIFFPRYCYCYCCSLCSCVNVRFTSLNIVNHTEICVNVTICTNYKSVALQSVYTCCQMRIVGMNDL